MSDLCWTGTAVVVVVVSGTMMENKAVNSHIHYDKVV